MSLNLIDSSGWLEFFSAGKNADFFSHPIEDIDNIIVSTINIYEVYKVIRRERDENTALAAISSMQQGEIIPVDSDIALDAALINHESGLPMADSFILATARVFNAVLWTQDSDFKNIEGVKYVEAKR